MTKTKLEDLTKSLKKVVSASVSSRIKGMSEAILWYDSAIPELLSLQKGGLPPEKQKLFDTAARTRALGSGIGAGNENERELALRMTLRNYERIWKDAVPGLPITADFLAQYESKRVDLEAQAAISRVKLQSVIDILNGAYRASGLEFFLEDSTMPRRFDGTSRIFLGESYVETLVKQSPVNIIFGEAMFVAKALGVENTDQGPKLNSALVFRKLPQLFDGIKTQLTGLPKSAFTAQAVPVAKPVPTATPGAIPASVPRTPRQPRPSAAGQPLVAGKYRPGSAQAIFYTKLSDGNYHTFTELGQGLNLHDNRDPVWYLTKHGKESGKWTVIKDKNGARMVIK